MAKGHATDPEGRALPDPSWPPKRKAPPGLEPLRRFANTTNRESGADRLSTPDGLDLWLEAEGWPPVAASSEELRRVVMIREAFRQLAIANTVRPRPSNAAEALAEMLGHLRFAVIASDGLGFAVDASTGVDRYLGDLLVMAVHAEVTSSWSRLKACDNERCRWLFYDRSNNSSGRWCSMRACGGRHKSASYRRRH